MSETIPADVRLLAAQAVVLFPQPFKDEADTGKAIDLVARAILSERDRATAVAEEHAKAHWGGPAEPDEIVRITAESIADGIRNPKAGGSK